MGLGLMFGVNYTFSKEELHERIGCHATQFKIESLLDSHLLSSSECCDGIPTKVWLIFNKAPISLVTGLPVFSSCTEEDKVDWLKYVDTCVSALGSLPLA